MSEAEAPVKTPATVPAAPVALATPGQPEKLDDVLLAMDVVDTLRHRERVVDQELDAETRETQLIARLKEIYTAQGINVPDRILKDGVKALEEQRFVYKPPTSGVGVKLARLYVSRSHWLPQSLGIGGALVVAVAGWFFFWAMPQANEWKRLPAELTQLSAKAQALAVDPAVDQKILAIEHAGEAAIDANDRGEAKSELKAMQDIYAQLGEEYSVRIVSRPGEDTGFYRIPDNNPVGRNYYLVVEPVAAGGKVLTVPVENEETQKIERTSKWAQRVTKNEFDKVAAEKAKTQIVQNDILGYKSRGELQPKYDVETPGGAITKW
ncbi:MAG: hypothetical protein GC155_08765 [Alphaproteobacteria bacterium]|nr:hypothetical protein [Alphaproteobacteria bacterium]